MDRKIILSTAYFGPVQYFSKFLLQGKMIIENHENFIKQTYRNRCIIIGANGPVNLTTPVLRGSFHKTSIHELEIDYSKRWQEIHWRTIEAAYRSAPFFDFYEDEIKPFYTKKVQFLKDFNKELIDRILSILNIVSDYSLTNTYFTSKKSKDILDYRELIRPKNRQPDSFFQPVPYHQVFEERFGFVANLSILDLIFNTGPESVSILKRSINQQT